MSATTVGVLALQGAFARHLSVVRSLGQEAVAVRRPEDLEGVDRLILPGGESTTMSFLLDSNELRVPLVERLADGMAVFGTCAGMILLAREILDGRPDQEPLGAIDLAVRRNAFGRQRDSFEVDLDVSGLDARFPAVFIRAPIVEKAGADVEILATIDDQPVLCRRGAVLVAAFHPELSDDARIHELFLRI